MLLLSIGCGSREQISDKDTEEQAQTEEIGRVEETQGQTNTEEQQDGEGSLEADGWESEYGYYKLEGRTEQEFVDYFLEEGAYEQEPYFSYVNPEGELQMALWNNSSSGLWCGICYAVIGDGSTSHPYGFVIDEVEAKEAGEWDCEPVEEVLSVDDFIALNAADSSEIHNVKENTEYDASGRLFSYEVTGDIIYDFEEGEDGVRESEYLYSIGYTYYDNGMTEKTYAHNLSYFGTLGHFSRIVYDEKDREIYSQFFYSSALSGEEYYLYENDSDTPFGCLIIDEGYSPRLCLY